MQNLNTKASILLWSIFLSLLMSSLFITMSIKINNYITQNSALEMKIKSRNKIQQFLSNKITGTIKIDEKTDLIISNNNTFTTSFTKGEKLDFRMNQPTHITLLPSQGSLMEYSTGAINHVFTEKITFFAHSGTLLQIHNLGGYAKLHLYSENEINFPYTKYRVVKTIGNKKLIIESGDIK